MRIVMTGLGDIAQKAYLPIISSVADVTPILCTRDQNVLSGLANRYRIGEAYSSTEEAILSRPDAMMIHSSTESHYEIVRMCLENEIAVFVDKPISYELKQTETLINLSEQKNIPLMVGFNRRYAPMYQALLDVRPVYLRYQKNRFNLPGAISSFVYDDFIHVLDLACAVGGVPNHSSINVHAYKNKDGQLALLDTQWQVGKAHYSLTMNRINAVDEERLECFEEGRKWQIDELSVGKYHANGVTTILNQNEWQSTLHKRGFVAMIECFIALVNSGVCDQKLNQDAWDTHQLCDLLVDRINHVD